MYEPYTNKLARMTYGKSCKVPENDLSVYPPLDNSENRSPKERSEKVAYMQFLLQLFSRQRERFNLPEIMPRPTQPLVGPVQHQHAIAHVREPHPYTLYSSTCTGL